MKQVFMPSMDELYQMQELGANIYKYILIKAIESLICNGLNYPYAGILKSAYNYLREDAEISRAICTLYPDEIQFSNISSSDIELCNRLLHSTYDENRVCGLDQLCMFDTAVYRNSIILKEAILLFDKELRENPRYRFEYTGNFAKRGAGRLLDDILNRKISDNELMFLFGESRVTVVKALTRIEPSYAISLPDSYFEGHLGLSAMETRISCLHSGIYNYGERYGISKNVGVAYTSSRDILSNPDQNVKRLIRCINDRNK